MLINWVDEKTLHSGNATPGFPKITLTWLNIFVVQESNETGRLLSTVQAVGTAA